MTRQRLRTLAAATVLATVAATLGGWAFDDEYQTAQARATMPAIPALKLPAPINVAAFGATLQRPLFSPDRKPLPAPDTSAPATEASPASRLVAVAIGPDRSAAILQLTSGKTCVLVQGEHIDGWTLSAIASDHVMLSNALQQVSLALPVHPFAARVPGQTSGQQ